MLTGKRGTEAGEEEEEEGEEEEKEEEEEEDEQEEEVVLHMQVVGQEVIIILDLPDTYLRRDHKQQGVEMCASSARMCTRGPPTPLVQKTQTLHPQRL